MASRSHWPVSLGRPVNWEIDWEKAPVTAYTSLGTPFTKWVPVMPRISDRILYSTFFLYRTPEDADKTENSVGTGFLVSVPSATCAGRSYIYAVSNYHVAIRDGGSVVRLNRLKEKPIVYEFDPADWTFNGETDIAAVLLTNLPTGKGLSWVPVEIFFSESDLQRDSEKGIGVGDDVFMLGRFSNDYGLVPQKPLVRFGNIAGLPIPVPQESLNNKPADSFCLDIHSRPGYSGSPVFLYRTYGSYIGHSSDEQTKKFKHLGLTGFLGIHWAQFPEKWEIRDEMEATSPARQTKYVKGFSGMTCVLPSWEILKLLNKDELKDVRDRSDREMVEAGEDMGPSSESAPDPSDAKRDAVLKTMLETPPSPKK